MPDKRPGIGALIRAALRLDKEETEQIFPKEKADAIFARIQKDLSSPAGEGSTLSSQRTDFEPHSIEEEPGDPFDWLSPEITPAESLPEGWSWYQYDDGSGSLRNPEGVHFFAFDRQPYHNQGGIEYKESNQMTWGPFWGTMSEFRKYAEETVQKKYLQKKEAQVLPLDEKLNSAQARREDSAIKISQKTLEQSL